MEDFIKLIPKLVDSFIGSGLGNVLIVCSSLVVGVWVLEPESQKLLVSKLFTLIKIDPYVFWGAILAIILSTKFFKCKSVKKELKRVSDERNSLQEVLGTNKLRSSND